MVIEEVFCSKNKDKDLFPFRVLKLTLEHNNGKIKDFIKKIYEEVINTNFNSSDSSGKKRPEKEILLKATTGILAEYVVFEILKKYNLIINNKELVNVYRIVSKTSINQIDIFVNKKVNNTLVTKTIEVRSSFPFYDLNKSICKNFDILGPYINNNKISENEKDYYLRLLFNLDYTSDNYIYYEKNMKKYIDYNQTTINTLLNDYFDNDLNLIKDLELIFVGGATNEMMKDDAISYTEIMESDTFNKNKSGLFKKIKLINGLDAISILNHILAINSHHQRV
jgi:hypothetical protein